jgi:hypothetical protein
MPVAYTGVSPICRPLSANTPTGGPCIALLAKRTYVLDAYGSVGVPAKEQAPLRPQAIYDGDANGLLLADTEAWPYKLRTDIVVHGHVHAHGTRRVVDAAVVVGGMRRDLRVSGDRRCTRAANGAVLFSEPEPFDKMPLGYDRAYGGYDHGSEAMVPNLFDLLGDSVATGSDPKMYSLCCYPRNRHGRGYRLASSSTPLDDVLLPNIEDPADLLRPDRLIVADPLAWWRQPLPAGTSWLHHGYFARCVYMGVQPFWRPLPSELPEFGRGYLPEEVRSIDVMRGDPWVFGLQSGASLGLQLSGVTGGTVIRLIGLHPELREVNVTIPAAPRMVVQTRWRAAEVAVTMLHHVELYPDHGLFTVVWRGAVEANRELLPEELDKLPFSVEWPS